MEKSDKLDISTFWIELSGTAAENASYALEPSATSSEHLPNVNLETAAKILEQIYITLWSTGLSFVISFEKNEKLKMKVITKNKQASLNLFNRSDTHQLRQQLNNSISAVSHITGSDCGTIEYTTVAEMKKISVSIQNFHEMMTQSQLNIMQIVKQNVNRALTKDKSTRTSKWTTASPNETEPKQLLESQDQPALDEESETEQFPTQQYVMDSTQERSLQTSVPFTSSSTVSPNETQPKQIAESLATNTKHGKKETTEPPSGQSEKMGTVQLSSSKQTNINAETIQNLNLVVPQVPALDYRDLGDKLKKDLWSEAEARSSYLKTAVEIKKAYKMPRLEIAEIKNINTLNYSYETSFQQREKVLQRFCQSSGNILINEIWTKSQEYAESRKKAFVQPVPIIPGKIINAPQINPNIIGVIGQAGIGKTTFTKMLVQQVLSKQILKSVSFLFYLFVREIDFKKDCNVLQFLVRSALTAWKFTEECDHALIEQINTDEDVLVVIDGFDEAVRTDLKYAKISLYQEASPELILLNLMSGNILPLAKKVITSRPAELFRLDSQARPAFLIQVLGLSKESQDMLGEQICGKEKYKKLKTMLYKNLDLSLYWYVPIYCIMAFSYFANTENMESVSITLTSLLTATLIDYAGTDHMRGKEVELEKLTHLAWNGIWSKNCIFPISSLEEVGLDYTSVQAFLQMALSKGLRVNMSVLQGDKLIFFPHLIWQEYFASIHVMITESTHDLSNRIKDNQIYSEVVKKILFGLCNRKVFYQLQTVITGLSAEKWIEIKRCLTQHLQKEVRWHYTNLLKVGSLLLEAQDDDMLAFVVNALLSKGNQTSITLQGSMLPSDAVSLCYLLKGFTDKGHRIKKIDVQTNPPCNFVQDSCNRFAKGIASGIKIIELVLSDVKFGDAGTKAVSGCIPQVEKLQIERCNITEHGIPVIVEKLSELSGQITELKLGGNKLTDTGGELLAPGISHIKRLHLEDCGITHVCVEKVVEGLQNNNAQLDHLSLAGNKIGNEGAAVLAEDLHRIKGLNLLLCHITEEGVVKLAAKAKELEHQMSLLDLSENVIGEKGVNELSLCGGKIDKLKLQYCDLSENHQKNLKDHLGTSVIFYEEVKR